MASDTTASLKDRTAPCGQSTPFFTETGTVWSNVVSAWIPLALIRKGTCLSMVRQRRHSGRRVSRPDPGKTTTAGRFNCQKIRTTRSAARNPDEMHPTPSITTSGPFGRGPKTTRNLPWCLTLGPSQGKCKLLTPPGLFSRFPPDLKGRVKSPGSGSTRSKYPRMAKPLRPSWTRPRTTPTTLSS